MGYIDRNLMPGEEVVWRGREHWSSALSFPIGIAVIGVFLMAVIGQPAGNAIGLICLLLGLIAAPIALIGWKGQDYALTNKRIIRKVGVLGRGVQEVPLGQVESTSLEQGITDRMNRRGNVVVFGTGGTKVVFPHVQDPAGLRDDIQRLVAKQQRRLS